MSQNFEIIPSIREVKYLQYALSLDIPYIQLSNAHIGNLRQMTKACHGEKKQVIVNHDLVGGLGNDKTAFQMLKQLYHVDVVIGSSMTKLNMLRSTHLKLIYRVPLMDSISVENALKVVSEIKVDAVELRPYYHALEFISRFKEAFDGDYYVAGFVNSEEKIRKSKEAGFKGAMTSTRELWGMVQ